MHSQTPQEGLHGKQQDQSDQVESAATNSPVDHSLAITGFESKKAVKGKKHQPTWSSLHQVLKAPKEHRDIESLPMLKFSELPEDSRVRGTKPLNMTAVVGDYDGGVVSVPEAIDLLTKADLSAIVYTTRRHTAQAPRWRVIAQLSAPLNPSDYSVHLDSLNGALGGILAPESWDITRCYFYGRVKGVEYEVTLVPGSPIDLSVAEGISWAPIGKPAEDKPQTKQRLADERSVDEGRALERAVTLDQVTPKTLHDLSFALEAVKERCDERGLWNATFLAVLSLKGTPFEAQARSLIEEWSRRHSDKWGVKEDDATKWDREKARDITYVSVFKWADDADRRSGVYGTPKSWRALADSSWSGQQHAAPGRNVVPYDEFTSGMEPPSYIWHRVLQKGCLYALTAKWGHGKTAVMITVAMHVAAGRSLGGRQVERQRVLYLCGENPADVQLRTIAAALKFGISESELVGQIFFTRRPFAIDNDEELERFVQEAAAFGAFGLVVIDTGPAHSSAQEENDNREMHKLAMAMRYLMTPLGNPATVALMHPTKEATRDSLQPRGGGAFSGSIDGELCAWNELGQVEFFHRTKFRGPGFKPMLFSLERFELPGMKDNFGEAVLTVLAVDAGATSATRRNPKRLTGATAVAHQALVAALADTSTSQQVDGAFADEASNALHCLPPEAVVTVEDWRAMAYDMSISGGDVEAKKKAFKRARDRLVAEGYVSVWKDRYWLPSSP